MDFTVHLNCVKRLLILDIRLSFQLNPSPGRAGPLTESQNHLKLTNMESAESFILNVIPVICIVICNRTDSMVFITRMNCESIIIENSSKNFIASFLIFPHIMQLSITLVNLLNFCICYCMIPHFLPLVVWSYML